MEFGRRVEANNRRIEELESVLAGQERALDGYREKLRDFEDNLMKIMKLDKDIHHRLVNPQPSPSL